MLDRIASGNFIFWTLQVRLEDLTVREMVKVKVSRKGSKTYTYGMASWREGDKRAMSTWGVPERWILRRLHQNYSLVIIMGNDIIDRMQAEEELREAKQAAQASKTQYELVVSMISDIVWRYDVNAQGEHIGYCISPVADRMLGLPDDTIGNSFDITTNDYLQLE